MLRINIRVAYNSRNFILKITSLNWSLESIVTAIFVHHSKVAIPDISVHRRMCSKVSRLIIKTLVNFLGLVLIISVSIPIAIYIVV